MKYMEKNEKAVSPVIGVILMVVITVIIAALLAVFAFGIGGPSKAPEANLRYESVAGTSGYLKVSNQGGDSLVLKDEKITVYKVDGTTVVDGISSLPMYANGTTGFQSTTQTLPPGTFVSRTWNGTSAPATGDIIIVQVLDVPTGQLISNAKVTVQ